MLERERSGVWPAKVLRKWVGKSFSRRRVTDPACNLNAAPVSAPVAFCPSPPEVVHGQWAAKALEGELQLSCLGQARVKALPALTGFQASSCHCGQRRMGVDHIPTRQGRFLSYLQYVSKYPGYHLSYLFGGHLATGYLEFPHWVHEHCML